MITEESTSGLTIPKYQNFLGKVFQHGLKTLPNLTDVREILVNVSPKERSMRYFEENSFSYYWNWTVLVIQ